MNDSVNENDNENAIDISNAYNEVPKKKQRIEKKSKKLRAVRFLIWDLIICAAYVNDILILILIHILIHISHWFFSWIPQYAHYFQMILCSFNHAGFLKPSSYVFGNTWNTEICDSLYGSVALCGRVSDGFYNGELT